LTVEGTTKKSKGRASLSRSKSSKKVSTTIIKGLKNFALPFSGFGKHHRCPMLNISTSSHAEAEGGLSLFLFSFLSLFFFLLYLPALYRIKALKLCTKLVFCAEILQKTSRNNAGRYAGTVQACQAFDLIQFQLCQAFDLIQFQLCQAVNVMHSNVSGC
jgi:hypothetical protein